jgi:hypothetical protein
MTAADSVAAVATANHVLELGAPSPGRCIYCDERCNVASTYHDYCRDEFETVGLGQPPGALPQPGR